MKKIVSALVALFGLAFTAGAQLASFDNGYYRVYSYANRYIYVLDNQGSVNMHTTSAEMGAIETRMYLENAVCDPASVLYFEKHGDQYDIQANGTGIYDMISYYCSLAHSMDKGYTDKYWCYASSHGMTMYLYDVPYRDTDEVSELQTSGTTAKRNWSIEPISSDSENYFGIKPTYEAGGKYYLPFYASFPFSFASSGMKAYYITSVDNSKGAVVYKEITGAVPAATPVVIECSSDNPSDNRLDIGTSASAVTGNLAKGVYYDCQKNKLHMNYVTYNKTSMRLFGLDSDGNLALVTSDLETVPRNTFYLPVTADAPESLKFVTQEEYEQMPDNAGITGVTSDTDNSHADVYNLQGILVRSGASGLDGLPTGIYIVNGVKVSHIGK